MLLGRQMTRSQCADMGGKDPHQWKQKILKQHGNCNLFLNLKDALGCYIGQRDNLIGFI